MYKKITLAQIKQEAKDLKKETPGLKHTQALNEIAQKYGYEKYEILKGHASNAPIRTNSKSVLQAFKNKHVAIVGRSGSGKTKFLFLEHSYLDKKDTLVLGLESQDVFNKNPYFYENLFDGDIPTFKHATFKTQDDTDVDFNRFNTIVIEEGWVLFHDKILLRSFVDFLKQGAKTVIMALQTRDDAKSFGLGLKHILDIEDDNFSTPLGLYEIGVSSKTRKEALQDDLQNILEGENSLLFVDAKGNKMDISVFEGNPNKKTIIARGGMHASDKKRH